MEGIWLQWFQGSEWVLVIYLYLVMFLWSFNGLCGKEVREEQIERLQHVNQRRGIILPTVNETLLYWWLNYIMVFQPCIITMRISWKDEHSSVVITLRNKGTAYLRKFWISVESITASASALITVCIRNHYSTKRIASLFAEKELISIEIKRHLEQQREQNMRNAHYAWDVSPFVSPLRPVTFR